MMAAKPAPEALPLNVVLSLLNTYVIYPIKMFVDALDSFYLVGGVSYWEFLLYVMFLYVLMRVIR